MGLGRISVRGTLGLGRTDHSKICNRVEIDQQDNEARYRSYQIGDGQEVQRTEVRFEDRVSEKEK